MNLEGKTIVVSRTDSIGDVMLTLPICAWLKEQFADCKVIFLGKGYTKPVVEAYEFVDQFENWEDYLNVPKTDKIQQFRRLNAEVIIHAFPDKEIASLSKKARTPIRIGTSHRSYHLLTCSHRVNFSRKNSNLHEAQLNFELLRPLGLKAIPTLDDITQSTTAFKPNKVNLPEGFASLKNYTILHPKSQGSALEWPIEKYLELANALIKLNRNVVFTGTQKEGDLFRELLPINPKIIDSTGKFSLEQLMTFIESADGIVACSTGPLHIGGFAGVRTIGLFSPKRPIHPGRWKALGKDVRIIVNDASCELCKKGKECKCIEEIAVERVLEQLN